MHLSLFFPLLIYPCNLNSAIFHFLCLSPFPFVLNYSILSIIYLLLLFFISFLHLILSLSFVCSCNLNSAIFHLSLSLSLLFPVFHNYSTLSPRLLSQAPTNLSSHSQQLSLYLPLPPSHLPSIPNPLPSPTSAPPTHPTPPRQYKRQEVYIGICTRGEEIKPQTFRSL